MTNPNEINIDLVERTNSNRPKSLYIMHYSWIEQVCKECALDEKKKDPDHARTYSKNFLLEEKLLMLIVSFSNHQQYMQASLSYLSKRTGFTAKTVNTALRRLEKWGLITRTREKGVNANIYELTATTLRLNEDAIDELNIRKAEKYGDYDE